MAFTVTSCEFNIKLVLVLDHFHLLLFQENYKDVVDWLKANAAKAESVPLTAPSAEKTPLTEAKANEINSQLNAKSGFARDGSTPSVANSWSFNLLPRGQTSVLSGRYSPKCFNAEMLTVWMNILILNKILEISLKI